MKVSVIIPARNESANVDLTMQSVLDQTRPPDEIVVADGCSTDDTVEKVRKYQKDGRVEIRIVTNELMTIGPGRNIAMRAAQHDLLVEMDLGNVADPTWLEELIKAFEDDPLLDLVGGVFYPRMGSPFERVSAAVLYTIDCLLPTMSRDEIEALIPENFVPGGMCFAVRRSMWEKAGGYCTWARKGQDRLFGHRVRRIGGNLGYTLDARVLHEMPTSFASLIDREFFYALWAARLGLPHEQTGRLAVSYVFGLLLLALSVAWPWLLAPFAILGLVFLYRRAWWKLRKVSEAGITFGLRDWVLAAPILLVRDASFLVGRLIGSIDALVRPGWKRKTSAYLENGV